MNDALVETPTDADLRSSSMAKWMSFLDEQLSPGVAVDAIGAVRLLRRFTLTGPSESVSTLLRRAIASLGIAVSDEGACENEGAIRFSNPERLLFVNFVPTLSVGAASAQRRQFVVAHELGHAIAWSLAAHPCSRAAFGSRVVTEYDCERFCNDFASEILVPNPVRRKISWPRTQLLLRDTSQIGGLPGTTAPTSDLTFWHLRALAAAHGVSIRMMISVLHRHAMLGDASAGVAVMRVVPNRQTGREIGLRIWQASCPIWGFIPTNKRAKRLGFSAAGSIFDTIASFESAHHREQLTVWEQQQQRQPRWCKRMLDTVCEYTAVDTNGEGRFIVATWQWPHATTDEKCN